MGTAAMLGTRRNRTGSMPKTLFVGSAKHSLSLPRLMKPRGRHWPADCTTAEHSPKSPSEIFRKKTRMEQLGPDRPEWKFQGYGEFNLENKLPVKLLGTKPATTTTTTTVPHALLNGRQTPYRALPLANAHTNISYWRTQMHTALSDIAGYLAPNHAYVFLLREAWFVSFLPHNIHVFFDAHFCESNINQTSVSHKLLQRTTMNSTEIT